MTENIKKQTLENIKEDDDFTIIKDENEEKNKGGRPKGTTYDNNNKIRFKITYFHPKNNLPIDYDFCASIKEVAHKLDTKENTIYVRMMRSEKKNNSISIKKKNIVVEKVQ